MSQVVEFLEENTTSNDSFRAQPSCEYSRLLGGVHAELYGGVVYEQRHKEEDVLFLEKIALESWRFLGGKRSSSTISSSGSSKDGKLSLEMPAYLQMTAISGEVQVQNNKVRALSHFPSVKLAGTSIAYRSGRWFTSAASCLTVSCRLAGLTRISM